MGLWTTIDHFREIIPIVVMRIIRISENALLDKKEEDKQSKTFEERLLYNKKQLLLNRPEISLIIDCKIKAN